MASELVSLATSQSTDVVASGVAAGAAAGVRLAFIFSLYTPYKAAMSAVMVPLTPPTMTATSPGQGTAEDGQAGTGGQVEG